MMINNSGDMTNKISDERLKELLLDCRRDGSSVVAADISEMEAGQIIEELLSLRSLNKRLVEAGDKLADSVSAWMTQYKPESSIVQSINRNNMRTWDALMKELEEK